MPEKPRKPGPRPRLSKPHRLSVTIDGAMLRRLDKAADAQRVSLAEIVRDALDLYLARPDGDEKVTPR